MVIWAAMSAGCSHRADDILERMASAYRSADRYLDDGVVTFHYTRGDSVVDRAVPFRVAFERPDRLRLDCYDASVVTDGTTLRAAVGAVPGQVLAAAVRSPLSLDQLFEDEALQRAITEGDAGCPIQLPLLLADDTLELVRTEALAPPRIGGVDAIEGKACDRIEIDKPDGTLMLWIDRANGILRRLSLPTGVYARVISEQEGQVTGASVRVEFRGASFEAAVPDEAFQFDLPEGARLVETLEPVSPPEPPPATVGRPCPAIVLTATDGSRISRETLAGSLAVLEFVFRGCGPCRQSIPAVRRAVADLREAGQTVAHHIVSIDEEDVSDEAIRGWLTEVGGEDGPFARDPRNVAARDLGIGGFPGLAVIGSDGSVADVRWGWHPQLEQDLLDVARADREGLPVREIVERRFEARLAEYERSLEAASSTGRQSLPPQVIAPRRQPDRLRLVRAWQARGVSMPGAVVRVDGIDGVGAEPEGLVVLDGWRTVVTLGLDGVERSRHELDLPRDTVVGTLRSAIGRNGDRTWAGWSTGSPRVFLFDDSWRRTASYPSEAVVAGGVADVEVCDLDADGTPEVIVASFGGGVEAARLSGETLWRNGSIGTVIDLTPGPPDATGRRGLSCVDARGRIVRIAADGVAEEPVEVGGFRIRSLAVAPVGAPEEIGGSPTWAMLGIAGGAVGRNTLVGIGPSLTDDWHLPLPDGIHRDGPVEPIAWGDLLGTPRRQWIVVATDGSVVLAWADGRIVDRYQHGEPITGVAGYRSGGEGFILVATPTRLESLRLDDIALD
jgi:outer membrane lipoprotein-sorting protein